MTIAPESGLLDTSREESEHSSMRSISMRPLTLISLSVLPARLSTRRLGYSPVIIESKSLRAPRSVNPMSDRSSAVRLPVLHRSPSTGRIVPASSPNLVPERRRDLTEVFEASSAPTAARLVLVSSPAADRSILSTLIAPTSACTGRLTTTVACPLSFWTVCSRTSSCSVVLVRVACVSIVSASVLSPTSVTRVTFVLARSSAMRRTRPFRALVESLRSHRSSVVLGVSSKSSQ